jgi:AraC-type DNA-binding domain-containing proteins
MFYFNNKSDILFDDDFTNRKLPISLSSSNFSQYYQMEHPFMLQFETYHCDNDEANLIVTTLSPGTSFYSVLTRKEAEKHILNRPLHQHNYYELLFVIDGEVYQKIEQKRHLYTKGSCCLLNENIRHAEEFSTDFRAVFLSMSQEFLHDLFQNNQTYYFDIEQNKKETLLEEFLYHNFSTEGKNEKGFMDFIPVENSESIIYKIHRIFDEIAKQILNPTIGSTFLIKGMFFKMLHLIDTPEYFHTTPIKFGTESEAYIFNQISHLMEEINGRVTRSDLEKQFNYSGDYINKIVKKYTGLSIFEYGMTFCLKRAADLLSDTNLSVSEIAAKLKFTNRAHFYKLFQKAYDMTPKQYRDQKKRQNR